MFDMLTRDELHDLHHALCLQHSAVTDRMLVPGMPVFRAERQDGRLVFNDEWALLRGAASELYETILAVDAEITRRREEARADA